MMSAHGNCARQTEEVVRWSAGNTRSGSYWQVRPKLFTLIANFFRETLRWILPLSPFRSPVLKPNLSEIKTDFVKERNFLRLPLKRNN